MNNLKAALEIVMQNDAEHLSRSGGHEFSPRFERKMRRLAKRSGGAARLKPKRLRTVLIAVALAAATFGAGAAVGAVANGGFEIVSRGRDGLNMPNITLAAVEKQDGPAVVETLYGLGDVPEGFVYDQTCFSENGASATSFYTMDIDKIINEFSSMAHGYLFFSQYTKADFSRNYSASKFNNIEETAVGDRPAYFMTTERYYGTDVILLWDDEDYIFEIHGCMTRETAFRLAESVVVNENAVIIH